MDNPLETIEASLNGVVTSLELIAQRADQNPRGRTEVRGYQLIDLANTIKEALDRLDVEIFNTTADPIIEPAAEPTALEQSNTLAAEEATQRLAKAAENDLKEAEWIKFRIPRFDEFHHAFVDVALADNVREAVQLELEREYAKKHFKQGRLTRETIEYISGEAEYQLSFIKEKLGDDRDPGERKALHSDKVAWKRLIISCGKVLKYAS